MASRHLTLETVIVDEFKGEASSEDLADLLSLIAMGRFSGPSQESLVEHLKDSGTIKTARVAEAMKSVDRGLFAKKNPYMDSPQPIGHSVNISAPHMHAHALELLSGQLREGCRALDVGSGSGYLTACMALMVGDTGLAVGVDLIGELVSDSITNLKKDPTLGYLLDIAQVKLVIGNGKQGFVPGAPYDAIHVGAAVSEIPKALLEQLRPGGRIIIPVGPEGGNQKLTQVDKQADGTITKTPLMGVLYGSLKDE